MPPARNSKPKTSLGIREGIIRAISTPLGFYTLSLLIVEATIGLVLAVTTKLTEDHVWWGLLACVWLFVGVVAIVSLLVVFVPKNLLYGKEEHSNPALEPSALQDAIEDTIAAKVKPECLKSLPN